jgi:hypothetical protein
VHCWIHLNRRIRPVSGKRAAVSSSPYLIFCCACLVLTSASIGAAQNLAPGGALRMDRVDAPTPNNQSPDPNTQLKMRDHQTAQQNFAAANARRKKQIVEDSTKLLKLAVDLKSQLDEANADTLSLSLIGKADEIEKLAHNVKEKMKLTVGAN